MTNLKTKLLAGAAVLAMTAAGAAYANEATDKITGNDNRTTIDQIGQSQAATSDVVGNDNTVKIGQGTLTTGNGATGNVAEIKVRPDTGASKENKLTILQNVDAGGGAGGGNSSTIEVQGDRNNIQTRTTSTGAGTDGANGTKSFVKLTKDADGNFIRINQGNSGDSEVRVQGEDNRVIVSQERNGDSNVLIKGSNDGDGNENRVNVYQFRSGGNAEITADIDIYGDSNIVNTSQVGLGHSMDINIGNNGNAASSNFVDADQKGTGGHVLTARIFDTGNRVVTLQDGSGVSHSMMLTVSGDTNVIRATQMGNGGHDLTANVNGMSNRITSMQMGDSTANVASVTQIGDGNVSNVSQTN